MSTGKLPNLPEFLTSGGMTGKLIANRDWSATPLGPFEHWPQSLKTMLGFLLRSPVPMVMLWGEDGVMLYNDAYSVFAGARHPQLLGSKVREGWAEVADFNDNVMRVGLAGGTLAYKDQELTLYRHDRPEQVWMDLDYSPVLDDEGRPAGVLAIVVETTERVAAERRLREGEARFRNMADHAPVMMWVTDPSGYCTYLNKGWYEFTGQTESEAEGFGWLDATHPADADMAGAAFRAANAEQRPFKIEYRLRRRDGQYRWAIDTAAPRFGPGGEYLGYVGSVIDIDERREQEERLRLSEARFRAAIDAIEGVLWTNDASGRMTGEQPGWQRLTGQCPDEYQGYGWASAVHPDDAQPSVEAWQAAVAERRTFIFEHRVRGADGRYRRYAIRAIPITSEKGEVLEWVGVHTDVTGQRDYEERLQQSEAIAREERDRAQEYLNVAGVLLLVINQHGEIETINRRGAEILGYSSPMELIGRDWFDVAIPPMHRADVRAQFDSLIGGDLPDVTRYENLVIRSDGSERLIAWRNGVLRDRSGRVIGSISSGDDVTEQREAEARERLLVQEVDHRAKNLLAVVQSVVQLTRGDDVSDFKEKITGRIQSLARTHGLLAAARWEGADLKQLIGDELAPYMGEDEQRVTVDGPAMNLAPPAAQALALVVHELATNAAKYGALSVPAGTLEVAWRSTDEGLTLHWSERGGPPTTPPNRRGFGSIVLHTSVERQLRGKVTLDWQPGGLVCTLDLPNREIFPSNRRLSIPAEPIRAPARAAISSGQGRTILVLEDEALIATQIDDVLSGAGYQVIGPASRVAEAFDRFYTTRPDAALLDINVAGDRSFAFAELLQAKQVPFALCTGYGEAALLPEGLSRVPLIAKPFNHEELLRLVAGLFA